MSPSATQIDRLVQEVMQRLGGDARLTELEKQKLPSAVSAKHPVEHGLPRHSLVLRQSVICLSDVEGKVDGGATVALPVGAVITPSARDYLRSRQARVECMSPAARVALRQQTLTFAMASGGVSAEPLVRTIEKCGLSVQRVPNSGLVGVVGELTDAVALGGNLGLLITEELAPALCLANRRRGVRAAWAHSVSEIRMAAEAMATNLLVLRATGQSSWQLQRIIQEFCQLATTNPRPRYAEVLE